MKAPLDWLAEHAALPGEQTGPAAARVVAEGLIRAGLEVETVEAVGAEITGPIVYGRVLEFTDEPQSNGKTIRWCTVDVGDHNPDGQPGRGIVCGAHNFAVGDLVVVSLPGAVLTGGFAISARKTYGHLSDGMICSSAEVGLPDDGVDGIMIITDPGAVVGADATTDLGLRADVLDIAVTPDRGYCFSVRGLARELATAADVTFTDPVDRAVPDPVDDGHPVRLEAAECAVFTALTVTGVDPGRHSPRWLTRRLQLSGMRPISLAVDITNYVMLLTGQPLHAYDADRLSGPIVVRRAAAGELLVTLDEVERTLSAEDVVIADDSGAIGLAGVMGGHSTEIAATTTTVVIEAAHFAAPSITATARRQRLVSEASRRFERGVDPAAGYAAAHVAARLLVELAGGTLAATETVAGAVPDQPSITIAAGLPQRILGTPVPDGRSAELLRRIGADVVEQGDRLQVTPPTWRPDLTDPYDLVEEVGRQIGFDTITPVLPTPPAGRGLSPTQRGRRAVRQRLVSIGLTEMLTFPFVSTADLDVLGLPVDDERRATVQLANPLAETSPALRTTLLPGLIAAAGRNLSRSAEDLALFELGSVFLARPDAVPAPRPAVTTRPSEDERAALDAALPNQPQHLAVLLAGSWRRAGWSGAGEPVGWQHAVAAADAVAAAVGVTLARSAGDRPPFHPGRCAVLTARRSDEVVVIGHAGELHPDVCRAGGLPARSAAVELDLDRLLASTPGPGSVAELSTSPVVKEDVALVVDRDVSAAELLTTVRQGAGRLLESARVFDVYTDDRLGPDRKSVALALRFRGDRTLTATEAAEARDAAVAAAAERHGAVLRT